MPSTYLDANAASVFLGERGFPMSASSLATFRCRGGGPDFRKWGRRPVYREADLLAWIEVRLGPARRSTSDDDAREDAGHVR